MAIEPKSRADQDKLTEAVYFRVYSGKADAGSMVFNANKGRRERLGRVVRMHAQHREDADAVFAGEIAAAVVAERLWFSKQSRIQGRR